ncbi:MAG: hypothetical protein KDD41_03405, partial [Flavobacteriales bacterium]|nr:hypothetical protein [Flavobacteriales bacterium]
RLYYYKTPVQHFIHQKTSTMPILRSILFIPLFVFTHYGFSRAGNQFPELKVENLEQKVINLPGFSKGKYCLIGLAYSKKAEADMQSWMQPVYDLFINQNTFIPVDYNLDVFFVPMFTGTNQVMYQSAMKKTKETIDPELASHVLFYQGSIDALKSPLNLKDKNVPYFFVLDESGEIVYTTSGAFTQKKLDQIERLVLE